MSHHKQDNSCNKSERCTVNAATACDCGCKHSSLNENSSKNKLDSIIEPLMIAISGVTLFLGFLPLFNEITALCFFLASAVLSGYELIPSALKGLKKLKMDENLLVLIAVIAAFAIGEGAEAAAVCLFFKIGESIEDYAVARSKKSIEKLYEITTNEAKILTADGSTLTVDANDVKVGNTLLISPFEKIPVDCESISNSGTIDASAITGESFPIEVTSGLKILSGSINGTEILVVKATAEFKNSAASKIIEVVENSMSKKGNADKFITKFAEIYTPVVVVLAILLAVIPSIIFKNPAEYIYRALVFLVASCPCALVLSIPLGFFAAIGRASKLGVIVKGGKYIELLAEVDTVLFDKTGTLTSDNFEIEKVTALNGLSELELLTFAGYADRYSVHPLASAILNAAPYIDESKIQDFKEMPGKGTQILLDGETVICGSKKFMAENNIDIKNIEFAQIYVAKNGILIGAIELSGKLRETSKSAVKDLFALGIKRIVMLTGDNEISAQKISEKCGINEYKAGLLPQDKTALLDEIKKSGGKAIFVGDGINDAPTLALADVGIAMGGGTSAAIEVGDVVLMNNNPANIVETIKSSRKAMGIIKFNIYFAISVKIGVLILGALGFAPMWAAIFADVGVCIIAVLNSARLLKIN
ncbi:MAG: heavy metal translocating P-type ATPase [Oscillospiraceae bacterium]